MKILVTAGATVIPIDRVRVISNIFKGRTGTNIAKYFCRRGNEVTLLTSNPSLIRFRWCLIFLSSMVHFFCTLRIKRVFRIVPYKTFDDLAEAMEREIRTNDYDVIIHSSAVSDYRLSRVCVLDGNGQLVAIDTSTKISSKYPKIYLEMVPTFKIVDLIRAPWGFQGKLAKFKLQVEISDEELLEIARKSRADSDADMIVANCLEWSGEYAYVVGRDGVAERVSREGLAKEIARRLI